MKTEWDFDSEYLPNEGTVVQSLPVDLEELWDKYPKQANEFVTNALINENVYSSANFHNGEMVVYANAWDHGSDILRIRSNLLELITGDGGFLFEMLTNKIDEVSDKVASMRKVADAINDLADKAEEYREQYSG